MERSIFTSESVTKGHPDKVCDQISDGILDAVLAKDPNAHMACETTAITDAVHIMGEITAACAADYEAVAREVIRSIGYTVPGIGFDADTCQIQVDIHAQSPDIAMGVNRETEDESGAGDQGIMFGFACTETESLMPLPIELAHRLTKSLTFVREEGILPYLLPDGKGQVSVEYDEAGKPACVTAVVVSTQHRDGIELERLREDIRREVILPSVPEKLLHKNTKFYINPTGRFVIGGPAGDTGLTGRKVIVDTYGGYARHGGGCFSGKDPSKVDRSAAYMARYIAKNVVAAGLAERCEVQLSYAIGVAEPVSVLVDTFGTGRISSGRISELIRRDLDLRPAAIIRKLDLRRPIYSRTASYGHFGSNTADMTWEQTDLAQSWAKELS
ncbi:MAG: methionine adenosyltransferase [Lachnospiraceae bacterium]|nr:methionine adenosyltransferase [Lachnospiraceae bacterium]